jgi:hypothetical protein
MVICPLPSSRVRIGYVERKGVLLCMEDAILMVADSAFVNRRGRVMADRHSY